MVSEDQFDEVRDIIKDFELHIFGVSSNQNKNPSFS
jgi:hypothetical protein